MGHWLTSQAALFAVADGMGGHPRGEVAAEIAVRSLGAGFEREARPRLPDPGGFLARALARAHLDILQEGERLGLADTPRTVLVACVVQDGVAHWVHAGDCRLYHLRDGRMLARTRDHTVVQELVDAGELAEEEAMRHPQRNHLLQCLGGYEAPRTGRVGTARLRKDDVVLLCSDGFWGPLGQRQLAEGLAPARLEEAVRELGALAEAIAGPQCDNVSALAVAWGDEAVERPAGAPFHQDTRS